MGGEGSVPPVGHSTGFSGEWTEEGTALVLALVAAAEAGARGEVPVGAVVRDPWGRVVAEGGNRTLGEGDPTAHAEIGVLRRSAARLGNHRLSGCSLVVTLRPCPMCLAACHEARVGEVGFAAEREGPDGVRARRAADLPGMPRSRTLHPLQREAGGVLRFFFELRR